LKPLQRGVSVPPNWTQWYTNVARNTNLTMEEIHRIFEQEFLMGETWLNDLYVVIKTKNEQGCSHLSIRRQDHGACRDWRHFQQIKNQLCGEEREALELYPAESRLVDGANQHHLWVMPEHVRIPVGWNLRAVVGPDQIDLPGCVQRKFEE
jgi:hypothetical protein